MSKNWHELAVGRVCKLVHWCISVGYISPHPSLKYCRTLYPVNIALRCVYKVAGGNLTQLVIQTPFIPLIGQL